jgi:hypothetical protein
LPKNTDFFYTYIKYFCSGSKNRKEIGKNKKYVLVLTCFRWEFSVPLQPAHSFCGWFWLLIILGCGEIIKILSGPS